MCERAEIRQEMLEHPVARAMTVAPQTSAVSDVVFRVCIRDVLVLIDCWISWSLLLFQLLELFEVAKHSGTVSQ